MDFQGGLRAVVWTDAFQVAIMLLAMLTVTALGTYHLGPAEVWRRSAELNRIEFLKYTD